MLNLAREVAKEITLNTKYHAEVNEVTKNNGIVQIGITVKGDSNIAPTVYIDELAKRYFWDVDMIADAVVEIAERNAVPQMDMSWFRDWMAVKDKIYMQVVNTKANENMLPRIPHKEILDLSLVFRVRIGVNIDGIATVLITSEHLAVWGKTVDDLYEIAMENTPKMFPMDYVSLADVLGEELPDGAPEIYVLSNTDKINGATVIFYDGVLKKIANGNDLTIIPSSVDEVLIIKGEIDKSINYMIRMINSEELEENKILSDHYYIYKADTDEVLKGE